MARRKKVENETPEQAEERLLFEKISNHKNRSEKTAWKRKLVNMEALLTDLQPIEDRILALIHDEKQPIMDQIQKLRDVMVADCIHPYEHLVKDADGVVYCKFCNRRINVANG